MQHYTNGKLDAVAIAGPLTLADTTMPSLALQFSPMPVAGEDIDVYRTNATVTIDANGASGSKLLVTLTVERRTFAGASSTDLTFAISGAAAKVAWSGTSKNGLTSGTASAATLKDVIDLINQLPGFKAWALHAPHEMSVNSDNFIDLTETGIKTGTGPDGFSEVLYRDASDFVDGNSDYAAYLRIGLPEVRDRNALRLLKVSGSCTGNTNGLVIVRRDDIAEYGETQEEYYRGTLATALTSYIDDKRDDAATVRGPLLLEVRSDDLTVCRFTVNYMQDSIGG